MSNDVLHAPAGKTDADIRNDVMSELSWDSRIGEKQIGVQVDHGVVTLGGSVDDWATCTAAVEAAHRVAGVQDVANELQVRNSLTTHLTDTDIAKAVRHALEWDALVPAKDIRSTVAGGVVVLEGVVATPSQREETGRIVGRLRGIKRLINRLQVSQIAEADAVSASIRQALNRRAIREASQIVVRVAQGHVTVEGIAQSREERLAILGAIRGTRGVQTIEDRLTVEAESGRP
jgi:osmotically-inducible protein OsmY